MGDFSEKKLKEKFLYERLAGNKDFSSFNVLLGRFFIGNFEGKIGIFIKDIIFCLICEIEILLGGWKLRRTTGEIVSSRS